MSSRILACFRLAAPSTRFPLLGFLMMGVVLVGGGVSPEKTSAPGARSSNPFEAGTQVHAPLEVGDRDGAAPTRWSRDTLRVAAPAGSPLILTLPGDGHEVFSLVHAPALSWLVGRAFLWNTAAEDAGGHQLLVARRSGEARDTVVLDVSLD